MGTFAVGEVVLVHFPFSDLSSSKLRPALIISQAEFGNYILCQITSSSFSSKNCIQISDKDISGMGLRRQQSYIRPDKIFTCDPNLINNSLGSLNKNKRGAMHNSLIKILQELIA